MPDGVVNCLACPPAVDAHPRREDHAPTVEVVTHRSLEACLAGLDDPNLELAPVEGTDRARLTEALAALEAEGADDGVLVTAQHQLASLMQSHLVESPPDIPRRDAGPLEVMFDEGDISGWVGSVLDWWRRIVPEKWRPPAERPERIGDGKKLRVALLADWGTGLYGAPECASSIESDGGYDLLLHLGDVYYSGTPTEVRENFLELWPTVPGAVSRACNSNHEMYSGGEGLFKETLPAFGQEATPFAVETDDWLLVGLDSAYEDHDLAHGQSGWLEQLISRAGERRVLLFCHHQPFSLLSKQGPKLVEKLAPLLEGGRIFAWYWGHEHRCVIYDRHPAWGLLGRCIGHGGMPYFRDDVTSYEPDQGDERWRRVPAKNLVPSGLLLDGPNPYVPEHEDRYGPNGYLTLELDGASLNEIVHAPDGSVLRSALLS
jgi:calcineurin-like phosphoesterase family protein